ncbi:universal stress protein [Tamlana sp. 2201CG12-4]|uniref:universal stress protein n=1 Tax=Tamlana sp. 2201CG12-4 TaxID=3112582 RepID=UPI002DB8CB5D|nr:universal stress protein [Tamlana sp. 2201CG12-4]MEC3906060.1 universal stress protein [Tamlana sp. 2201CG12-4]
MKTNRYKILVLSDLKSATNTTLKSAVSLAKKINGDIEFFHVKKPSDIVEQDNQLSAMRTINKDFNATDKKIKSMISSISKDYKVNINYTFAAGNIKYEIGKIIKEYQPDIVVLGKRKSKPFNLIGDSITKYVLKTHKGGIMIAADNNVLEPDQEISLATLNDAEQSHKFQYVKDLMNQNQKPLKVFKIASKTNPSDTSSNKDINTIEYVFEHSDNTFKGISKYLNISEVNLLCIDKGKNDFKYSKIKAVLDHLNVSLLVN